MFDWRYLDCLWHQRRDFLMIVHLRSHISEKWQFKQLSSFLSYNAGDLGSSWSWLLTSGSDFTLGESSFTSEQEIFSCSVQLKAQVNQFRFKSRFPAPVLTASSHLVFTYPEYYSRSVLRLDFAIVNDRVSVLITALQYFSISDFLTHLSS